MGCSSIRLDKVPDINTHHLGVEKRFDKNTNVDLTENPNTRLMESVNYYRGQRPDERKEFDDDIFPPENQSLQGKYQLPIGEKKIEWKSASKIWGEEVNIFGETISLDDIQLGLVQDAYFVAAIKALVEYPSIIFQLFKTMVLPKDNTGIQIFLKIEGVWTIYIIDDNFPVSKETGETIFCDSPTKHIWAVLLEKAWAKANLGYANIIKGLPIEVFRTFTPFCIIPIDVPIENHESLWENIKVAVENNCIMTATTKEGTKGVEDVGLVKNNSYILLFYKEKKNENEMVDENEKSLKMLKFLNPLVEGEWIGPYSKEDPLWTNEDREYFNYKIIKYEDDDNIDKTFYISFDDLCRYFYLINILIPIRPYICQTINIPKESAANYNIIKIKFKERGVFSFSIERQVTRFHKDLKEDYEIIENILFAKIYKEDKILMYVDSCFNEMLSTRVEPGEYLIEFNLDYKTLEVNDIRSYNIHIGSSIEYKLKLSDPDDKDLTVMKTIMIPKIESLYKYKYNFKESFVFFTGNRFGSSSYGFCYMKNRSKETKFLKPNFYIKNYKRIDGEFPKALKMVPDSKFFCLYNRINVNLPFQTGIKPNICRYDDIQKYEIIEPEIPELTEEKYFIDDYEDAKPSYTFEG